VREGVRTRVPCAQAAGASCLWSGSGMMGCPGLAAQPGPRPTWMERSRLWRLEWSAGIWWFASSTRGSSGTVSSGADPARAACGTSTPRGAGAGDASGRGRRSAASSSSWCTIRASCSCFLASAAPSGGARRRWTSCEARCMRSAMCCAWLDASGACCKVTEALMMRSNCAMSSIDTVSYAVPKTRENRGFVECCLTQEAAARKTGIKPAWIRIRKINRPHASESPRNWTWRMYPSSFRRGHELLERTPPFRRVGGVNV
jgi:hypothetical protein